MAVPLGFVEDTRVATPGGDRPIASLRAGDVVLAWADGRVRPAHVAEVVSTPTDQLVRVALEGAVVRGCTPGTAFYDAFEDAFRAAGSLSATSELLLLDGDVRPVPLVEVTEQPADGALVWHLRLEPPAGAWFADGVVVAHKERG